MEKQQICHMKYKKIDEYDDGTLKYLNIKDDSSNKSFMCKAKTQGELVNTKFWILDYVDNVETRYSNKNGDDNCKVIVYCEEYVENEGRGENFKFFSGSSRIKSVLRCVGEMDAFPRLVTLRKNGNSYYFE